VLHETDIVMPKIIGKTCRKHAALQLCHTGLSDSGCEDFAVGRAGQRRVVCSMTAILNQNI
jgi:hypothetical protein